MTSTAPTVTLPHGAEMPLLGLGTYSLDGDRGARAVRTAIESGYRLLDTAENYRNEAAVGQGVREAGVPREELFLTTKFNRRWHSVEGARQACEASMERLGVEYVDLLLIHWPNPDQGTYDEAWRGLIGLLEDRRVRAIGTSNFKPAHLERIIDATGVVPDVNQINLNPYAARTPATAFHAEHGIVTEAWSPIKPAAILSDPVVTGIARRHERTPAQVVLRWITQQGFVAIPKSADPQRQRENLAVFDFELDPDELAAIRGLDRGEGHVTDSDSFGH